MKKLTLILLLSLLFFGIQAQEETSNNRFVLGGSLSFSTQKNTYPVSLLNLNFVNGGRFSNNLNDSRNTIFRIDPYFGKELNPHWLLGLQLGYAIQHYRVDDALFFSQPVPSSPSDFSEKSHQVTIGLFSRYTLNPTQRVNFFLQPSIAYSFFGEDTAYDGEVFQREMASYIEIGIGLGMLYQINDRLRATLRSGGLNYINGKWEIRDTDISQDFSSFGANFSLSNIFLGVEVRL